MKHSKLLLLPLLLFATSCTTTKGNQGTIWNPSGSNVDPSGELKFFDGDTLPEGQEIKASINFEHETISHQEFFKSDAELKAFAKDESNAVSSYDSLRAGSGSKGLRLDYNYQSPNKLSITLNNDFKASYIAVTCSVSYTETTDYVDSIRKINLGKESALCVSTNDGYTSDYVKVNSEFETLEEVQTVKKYIISYSLNGETNNFTLSCNLASLVLYNIVLY